VTIRLVISLILVVVGVGIGAVAFAAFLIPHQATGTVNTAVSGAEALYICQPSGTIISPQTCPIDTDGANETIFAASEDLMAGSVAWQKIRVTNVGSEPWDILGMMATWIETSDPSGLCTTIPEGVRWKSNETTEFVSAVEPGVTVLGQDLNDTPPTAFYSPEPVEGIYCVSDARNNNHGSVNGSAEFPNMNNLHFSVHVEPDDSEDLLLGLRLPIGTPDDCFNVVWQLTTDWAIQLHNP
jgi:hypothetical protein